MPAEVERVLGMYEWLFAPPGSLPPAWDPERARRAIAEAIESAESTLLVAEHRGELLGFCSAYIELNSVRYGVRCWVEDLAVSPEHRSEGVGKALLDAAKVWARERGATHLELDSGEKREPTPTASTSARTPPGAATSTPGCSERPETAPVYS